MKTPYVPQTIPNVLDKLVKAFEAQRDLNAGGYGGGVVCGIKGWGKKSGVTSCSPFTATALAMIFDPDFDSKDPATATYAPVAKREDGKVDPIPFLFYQLHNTFSKINAVGELEQELAKSHGALKAKGEIPPLEFWGMATKIDAKKMRRGDFIGIHWGNGGGHATFCWDVHLDANGDVDCFLFVSSNGMAKDGKYDGPGVTIWGVGKGLSGTRGSYKKTAPMFVDHDDIVATGYWVPMPGVDPKKIDLKTFRVRPKVIVNWFPNMPKQVDVGRFHGYTPPEPYAWVSDGKAPPPKKEPEPQAKAKAKIAPAAPPAPKKDEAAPKKEKPVEVEQKKEAPTAFQLEVEELLQELWKVKWIDVDPGKPDNVADAQSQAAIKDFQTKLGLEPTGYADRTTRYKLRLALGWTRYQHEVEAGLQRLFAAGKLDVDPGEANGVNDEKSRAAIKAFQGKNGLKVDGISGPATRKAVAKALETLPADAPAPPDAGKDAKDGDKTKPQLFFGTNYAKAGSEVEVRLHAAGMGQDVPEYPVKLIESKGGKTHDAVRADGPNDLASGDVLQILILAPDVPEGTKLKAKVEGKLPDGKPLDVTTAGELEVGAGAAKKPADAKDAAPPKPPPAPGGAVQGAQVGAKGEPPPPGGKAGVEGGANAGDAKKPDAVKEKEKEAAKKAEEKAKDQPKDDENWPKPRNYTPKGNFGANDIAGQVKFIKADKPPQPTAWKNCKFSRHSHFAPEACVDMNGSTAGWPFGLDMYGPGQDFTPKNQFVGDGFGGVVLAKIANGTEIWFGHFNEISIEVYRAAEKGASLPAGTFLGRCTVKIGLTGAPHCHLQTMRGGKMVPRTEWLPWLGCDNP